MYNYVCTHSACYVSVKLISLCFTGSALLVSVHCFLHYLPLVSVHHKNPVLPGISKANPPSFSPHSILTGLGWAKRTSCVSRSLVEGHSGRWPWYRSWIRETSIKLLRKSDMLEMEQVRFHSILKRCHLIDVLIVD